MEFVVDFLDDLSDCCAPKSLWDFEFLTRIFRFTIFMLMGAVGSGD